MTSEEVLKYYSEETTKNGTNRYTTYATILLIIAISAFTIVKFAF